MHPLHHAESSARRHGGRPEDYVALHAWFDASKAHLADFRHRALRHHSAGIFEAEAHFGVAVLNSDGRAIPTRILGEQHVKEDCAGRVPSVADWLLAIRFEQWMSQPGRDTRHHAGQDCSHEAWKRAVAGNATTLGYADWLRGVTSNQA
jgi:hypothetical protein